MSAVLVAILGLAAMFSGYRFYSKFIAERIYRLDPSFEPPSHRMRDGVDYVPTHRVVLWGHHFTAVAGAAPIIGPGIAEITDESFRWRSEYSMDGGESWMTVMRMRATRVERAH